MTDLSVLIPSRNEMFLRHTVEDILAHSHADTEIIVVLDGGWPVEPLEQNPKVTLIYRPVSIGQRAAVNEAARVSQARYVMKADAHCGFADGFDVELIRAAQDLGDDVTQVPVQFNWHAFDWMCDTCGKRTYQGPTPSQCQCGATTLHREMVWSPRKSRKTTSWRFDRDMHFQYWGEFSRRPEGKGEITETMSCLGACYFLSRARFWELGGLDEAHGSWGQMGTEVACKSWLSGGRLVTNQRTWYGHLFRTQGGDFGFPYPMTGSEQDRARAYSRNLWLRDAWPGAKRKLQWLIDHFSPVPDWEERPNASKEKESIHAKSETEKTVQAENQEARSVDVQLLRSVRSEADAASGSSTEEGSDHPPRVRLGKGVVWYSDCRLDPVISAAARRQLLTATNGHPIVSVTLSPLALGRNIVLQGERGILTMYRQILAGLEASDADIIFLCEHDVLYPAEHFAFTPERDDTYYYNRHTWKVDTDTGRALHYITDQTSGLCAYRRLLLDHYRARVERVARDGYDRHMGHEPGKHHLPNGVDNNPFSWWMSERPLVDIRHGKNLTPSRWSRDQFRDQRNCQGWTESDTVPGWGRTGGRFSDWLAEVT